MQVKEKHPRIVFCDFDGTITVEETFVGMLKRFAQVDYDRMQALLVSREITLREGVRQMVESIPSERYPEILNYIRDKELRPGLQELLDFLAGQNVPFVIISGGLVRSIELRLRALAGQIHAIYAADVDTAGEYLQVVSDFEGGTELVAKADIMSRYAFTESVAIGDGLTDVNIALRASVVFARGHLRRYLQEKGKSYQPWNDFFDVRDRLADRWQAPGN